jgi:hypothetical protein
MGARISALFELAQEHANARPRMGLDPHYARELAQQNIESLRSQELADILWQYRARWYELEGGRRTAESEDQAAAARALAYIHSSALYRLVRRCGRLPLYGAYARVRFGADWQREAEGVESATPREQLDFIRASRTYRTVIAIKKLPPVAVLSKVRHGRNYRETIPELLRHD